MSTPPADLFAKMILASQCEGCPPIYTLHLRYPRFIHAEFMTHRVFSRNARSSRAVPVKRMIEEIETNPVVPWHWGKNQAGMQAGEECSELVVLSDFFWLDHEDLSDPAQSIYRKSDWAHTREEAWLLERNSAVQKAEAYANAGYHKQVVNRLLEPFMWIDVLVTATDWGNFFKLRDHSDAEPHMQDLARAIRTAIEDCKIQQLEDGDWHLPYISDLEKEYLFLDQQLDLSAARCARISYTPFDGRADLTAEMARAEKLKTDPLHASPFEHQAMADPNLNQVSNHRNFVGYAQYRAFVERESAAKAAT